MCIRDRGLGLGGQIEGGDTQRTDPVGERLEHDLLSRRRHGPQLGQLLLVVLAPGRERGHERRHQEQGDQLEGVVQIDEAGARHRHHGLGQDGERADAGGGPGPGERRGDRRRGDQEWSEMDAGRGQDVDHRDDHDQSDRYRQQRVAWLLCQRLPFVASRNHMFWIHLNALRRPRRPRRGARGIRGTRRVRRGGGPRRRWCCRGPGPRAGRGPPA